MQRTLQGLCWGVAILLESRASGARSNEAKILPGDSEVWDESPGGRAVLCTCRACSAFPFSSTCRQPGAPSGMLWDSIVPPMSAERSRELWHCLTEQAASSFYTWFPRKLDGLKRRSIAFCFEVLNLSFPVSPAGTKLIEWRQSAWFSWYPTAVTILLPELLTHAAMQQESYFSMNSSEERFIALQKSSTEPLDVFAKCSPALQCCGCFSMGWFVAQSIERGSAWTPSPQ